MTLPVNLKLINTPTDGLSFLARRQLGDQIVIPIFRDASYIPEATFKHDIVSTKAILYSEKICGELHFDTRTGNVLLSRQHGSLYVNINTGIYEYIGPCYINKAPKKFYVIIENSPVII